MQRHQGKKFWAALTISVLSITAPVLASPLPNQIQPLGRFSPRHPLQINILNQTGLPLEYGLTDPRKDVEELQPGKILTLKNFRVPNCLAINTPMMSPVRYLVSVKRNVATVKVRVVNDVSGDHCLDVNKNGVIYAN